MPKERLQKILASAGIASRRACEELILEGAVRVNDKVIYSLPAFADPEKDAITVHGKRLQPAAKVYYLLNKPAGVICTSSDPQGRPKAVDMVPGRQRVYCVGRLDADTTGIIILTNDSELTNRLTHPKYEIPKTYIVTVKGNITAEAIEKLKKGVWLSEGKTGRAAVKVLNRSRDQSTIEITISQGLNRQVRRSFAKVGYKVKSLKRTRIGKIDITGLGVGKSRPLKRQEVVYLKKLVQLVNKSPAKE